MVYRALKAGAAFGVFRDDKRVYFGFAFVAEGTLPWRRVTRIAAQVLKALWEAHELGIVHRDIKPANVLVIEQVGHAEVVNARWRQATWATVLVPLHSMTVVST